jgi:multiple sugar transport system substrate-binding protein
MRSNKLLSLFAVFALVAAACSSNTGASPTSAESAPPAASGEASAAPSVATEPVTLTFATYVWQPATIAATDQIVADWNAANPNIQVEIVPIDVNSVHDALVTQFQGGTAADIIHDESADLAGFVQQGYIADMTGLISEELKADIPQGIWDAVTYDGVVSAVPMLLQSYVVFANADHLESAGIALPTLDSPWTWDDFRTHAKALTTDGRYGVGVGLKSATALMLSTSLNYGGQYFYEEGGNWVLKFDEAEQQVPTRIHAMAYEDQSIEPNSIGLSGSDNLASFLAGNFSMFVGGNFYAQQLTEQAPEDFNWVMLPLLKGDTQTQAANPQTMSVSAQSEHPNEAMQFIEYFTTGENTSKFAQGDWLAPTSKSGGEALLAETGGEGGWDVVVSSAEQLTEAPFQKLQNYPQWKDQIATPAFQQYFANQIDLETLKTQLIDGWATVNGG